MSDDEATPHFDTPEQEIKHWKSKVADMQDALREAQSSLTDFMESSKDLEAEMEKEISASSKTISGLQRANESLKDSVEDWKLKYQKSLAEHSSMMNSVTRELNTLRESHNLYKAKLRDMEMDNDELENAERMIASSLADMESRYNKTIERTALLEEELVQKSALQDENQRLKDELRDLAEEVAVLRDYSTRSRATSRTDTIPEDANVRHSADEAASSEAGPSSLRRRERPVSYTADRPSSRQALASPTVGRTNFSQRVAGIQAHARRGSRDVRDLVATPTMGESPDSIVRSKSTRAIPSMGRDGAATGSPVGRSSLRDTVRGLPRTPTTAGGSRTSGVNSMVMMQTMVAKMKTLEGRIISARNLSSVSAVESSIPRPSSRMGSVGPGGGGGGGGAGYASPTLSQSARRTGPRPSLENKTSIASSIPLPTSGLSRSTTRRPSSRMSDRGTPPMPNVGLPRSATPSSQLSTPYPGSSRGPSPLEFMDHDPAALLPQNARLGTVAIARRRSSISSNGLHSGTVAAAAGTPAKVRVGSALPVMGSTPAVRREAGARASSTHQRPPSGQFSKEVGPPTAWKASARRSRSGSMVAKATTAATTTSVAREV
ncbi:uncharacterized protein PFL1_03001 [Pseudozyma flocculosa PF-1]|uniref:Related to nuclear distribution protein RO11 n=2 Tax=Pseudozyma flocculosa TaxID=84751 RepID=A0A5C3F1D6_9BASI|nr:uncharacterized protein PFL1_03001 [Pseudozyma flocculosa PF-1]EPQ29246.1 hypothetical protein PFL1_03001 [Pseudozyma flocculosa PF-1]SPO37746.1 related to nuclear distribution protein RO11 [Pseudozyma flocculosa]